MELWNTGTIAPKRELVRKEWITGANIFQGLRRYAAVAAPHPSALSCQTWQPGCLLVNSHESALIRPHSGLEYGLRKCRHLDEEFTQGPEHLQPSALCHHRRIQSAEVGAPVQVQYCAVSLALKFHNI